METLVRRASDVLCVIVGPTTSSKSDLALGLACVLPGALGASGTGEIVFADALQLYHDMDVRTTKTPVEERRGIVHHQIDMLETRDEASMTAYQKRARADVADIHEREGTAMVAGGSGLYQRAFLDVIRSPGTDPAVCVRLEEEVEGPMGPHSLYDHPTQLDPISAEHIDPHNVRRIVRALEVTELTGHPYSASMPRREFVAPSLMVTLRHPMKELDGRITVRTRAVMDDGLAEEVRTPVDADLCEAKTASRATGYTQALAAISGQMSEGETVESIALATRQLARRQVKWLRLGPRMHWPDVENFDLNEAMVCHVVELTQREAEPSLGRS